MYVYVACGQRRREAWRMRALVCGRRALALGACARGGPRRDSGERARPRGGTGWHGRSPRSVHGVDELT
eukprot:6566100-Prymnesium_polylepis.1